MCNALEAETEDIASQLKAVKLTGAEWRIYASVKYAIIGSDNGLSLVRRQVIIWTTDGLLSVGPLGNKHQWNLNKNSSVLIDENECGNVVCKMACFLSRLQCVNSFVHGSAYIRQWAGPWFNRVIAYLLIGTHYIDVIMGTIASQITSLTIVYSTVYSDANQRKY